jgi:hypothetical protein
MTSFYGPSTFSYDAEHDQYLCPQGQPLLPFRTAYQAEKVEYRADAATCNACPRHPRSVRQVSTVDNCTAPSMPATLNGCMATTRRPPIKKRCASGRSGWNPYLLRPKTGMGCAASARGCSGVSTWRPYGLPQGKISSGCSKNEVGDGVRSQWRPYVPSFAFFAGASLVLL